MVLSLQGCMAVGKTTAVNYLKEHALKDELDRIRTCMPARILFLDASDETLRRHKEHDSERTRTFFEHHLTYLMPLKRECRLSIRRSPVATGGSMEGEGMGGFLYQEWFLKFPLASWCGKIRV